MISMEGVGSRQRKPELLSFIVNGTGTAAITFGSKHATLTDNGTGDYTLTLVRPARQALIVVGVAPVTVDLTYSITSTTASAVRLVFANLSGTDTDTIFHISLLAFRSPTEY